MQPHLAPEVGFTCLKDAVALIRCCAYGDTEGIGAIVNGTPHLHELAGMTATITALICLRAGLDSSVMDAMLNGIASELADLLLDQKAPGGIPGD